MAYFFESETFATALKDYRIKNKLTQELLAKELDIARPTINLLENQKAKPTREQIEKICTKIDMPISHFFFEKPTDPLLYMMGSLDHSDDRDVMAKILERIDIRNRYILLSRRGAK